jgi:hypothetical protein
MKIGHWILVKGKLKRVKLLAWAKWFENVNSEGRITAKTKIGNIEVSTVFLGIDHNFLTGKPLLWETMIFGSDRKALKGHLERYSSLKEAEKGHKRAIDLVKAITCNNKAKGI